VGRTNSACRVGVVSLDETTSKRGPGAVTSYYPGRGQDDGILWLDVPGDPREHYIARMDWAANSEEVVLQQLNRLQNTNTVMLGNAHTGSVHTAVVERDPAWVDVHDHLHWIDKGKKFTWLSECDGWRRVYVAARSGGQARAVTPEGVDVI